MPNTILVTKIQPPPVRPEQIRRSRLFDCLNHGLSRKLTLFLPPPVNRWANIIVAGFFLVFNLISLPGYPSVYDKFLLAVSLVFNGLTIWLAWGWV